MPLSFFLQSTADSASSSEGSDTELLSGLADFTALLTGLLQGVQLSQRQATVVSTYVSPETINIALHN